MCIILREASGIPDFDKLDFYYDEIGDFGPSFDTFQVRFRCENIKKVVIALNLRSLALTEMINNRKNLH